MCMCYNMSKDSPDENMSQINKPKPNIQYNNFYKYFQTPDILIIFNGSHTKKGI